MNTFSKLSAIAQYDDMIRTLNKIVLEGINESEGYHSQLDNLEKLYSKRELEHDREKRALKNDINILQKEVKKLNRQLTESRSALVREVDEKKTVLGEKKALLDQIRQVRLLVEKESYGDTDAHRRRVIKCLDVERLSPIQSDDSDDCVSGLDYDRTEDDLMEADAPPTKASRRSALYDDALDNLNPTEQPTLPLYRYLDKNSDNQDDENILEPRRSSRLAVKRRTTTNSSSNPPTSATTSSNSNQFEKYGDLNAETDTNTYETDDNDIEYVRQQLKKYEANKERLAAANSTPNLKDQKRGMTLSAKSTASLMKSISSVNTPVANALKPHTFSSKKTFSPIICGPCGGKIGFYGECLKCEVCAIICHTNCKDKCPLPCVKITAPSAKSKQKRILISDYVNCDAVPKVPALIVHCCNEIERPDNITTAGLYRVVAHTKQIEDLQRSILKSKSGMPNLSKADVHLLTGVVKRFLQGLDESLITTTLWSHLAEAVKLDSESEAKTHICFYISYDMPTANRDTLSFLMQHLHAIARHADKNLMTTKALSKTLAPTIIGNSCRNPETCTIRDETKIQLQIMEALFNIEESFWAKFVQRIPSTDAQQAATSLGSRLLDTPTGQNKSSRSTRSRLAGTLPTPKLKPLFS